MPVLRSDLPTREWVTVGPGFAQVQSFDGQSPSWPGHGAHRLPQFRQSDLVMMDGVSDGCQDGFLLPLAQQRGLLLQPFDLHNDGLVGLGAIHFSLKYGGWNGEPHRRASLRAGNKHKLF